jgi:cyclic pyranopterin phosphate synthase
MQLLKGNEHPSIRFLIWEVECLEKRSRRACCLSDIKTDRYNSRMDEKLSHMDETGRAQMVNVGKKPESERWAIAKGRVLFSEATLRIAKAGDLKKGDLRSVSEVAGVLAAKRTSDLIPLCHPLLLTHIDVRVEFLHDPSGVEITASVKARGQTGVEMEALTAVSIAALTVYDMVKGVEKSARITDIRLVEKHGGVSGDFISE